MLPGSSEHGQYLMLRGKDGVRVAGGKGGIWLWQHARQGIADRLSGQHASLSYLCNKWQSDGQTQSYSQPLPPG